LKNHGAIIELVKEDFDQHLDYNADSSFCAWMIEVNKDDVQGHTEMDNFDMHFFLTNIGVDSKKIGWKRYQSEPWRYEDEN